MKKRFIADLFISNRWYFSISICIFLFIAAFFVPFIWHIAVIALLVFSTLSLLDYLLLFSGTKGIQSQRIMRDRMHLGHENAIQINVQNTFPFKVEAILIDEVPVQFQDRNFKKIATIAPGKTQTIEYVLKPLSRGVYNFGELLCFAQSPIGLFQRRFRDAQQTQTVKVYPSSKYLRQYQLLALNDNSSYPGTKRIRRLGHSMEFEQIKEYVQGDDMRSINWKATARKGNLMVNNYIDARSQQIYCLIDKGRTMMMPFNGMTLLDYAINAALIFLNIALLKQDRAGLITFSSSIEDTIPADRGGSQSSKIQEVLYAQTTHFAESNYEYLATSIYRKVAHRGFLLLFTNFESLTALDRQMPYLKKLASRHLLCVVLFQNTLLKEIHEGQPDTLEGIYIKTIADRFDFEKKQIAKELRKQGILSVLTTPAQLTVDVINKYLEIKSRQML